VATLRRIPPGTILSVFPGGAGGGGGTIPEGRSGRPESGHRGHGGTLSAGGAGGGALGCTSAATSGTQLKGGNSNGGVCVIGAGGGDGSGYFGGGGAARGAGGGGSAFPRSARSIDGIFVDPEIFFNEPHAGNGDVTISYRQRFPFPLDARSHSQLPADLTIYETRDTSALRFLPRWLEAGKHADLTVLAENLFGVAPEEIHSVPVKLTMMDGRITHDTR